MDNDYYPRVPEEKNSVVALLLSLLIHGFFIGALFFGIQWKRQTGSSVQVELWRSGTSGSGAPGLPSGTAGAARTATPEKPPEKPLETWPAQPDPSPAENPAQPKPDIVVKGRENAKPEKQPAPEPARPNFFNELNHELRARQRAERENEIRSAIDGASGQARGAGGQGGGSGGGAGLQEYEGKVRGKVRGNVILPSGIPGNPGMQFRVTQLPSGEILTVRLIQSSGYPPLDEAVERAILKSSPLPKPENPAHFQRELLLNYHPYPL